MPTGQERYGDHLWRRHYIGSVCRSRAVMKLAVTAESLVVLAELEGALTGFLRATGGTPRYSPAHHLMDPSHAHIIIRSWQASTRPGDLR
jgi:hypothetical protein